MRRATSSLTDSSGNEPLVRWYPELHPRLYRPETFTPLLGRCTREYASLPPLCPVLLHTGTRQAESDMWSVAGEEKDIGKTFGVVARRSALTFRSSTTEERRGMGRQVPGPPAKSGWTAFSYNVDGRWNCSSCSAKGRGAIDLAMGQGLVLPEAVNGHTPYAATAAVSPGKRPELRQVQVVEQPKENPPSSERTRSSSRRTRGSLKEG